MPVRKSKKQVSLSKRKLISAVWDVLKLAYKVSPFAIGFKFFAAITASVIPLITVFFFAQSATEAANAFNGNKEAIEKAIFFVSIATIFGLLSSGVDSLNNYIGQIIRFKTEAKISDMMYEHFVKLDFWRYDDKETGDLYERANDFSKFFGYVFDQVTGIFQSLIGVIVSIIGLSFVSPWLSLFVLVAVIPNMYIQYKLSRQSVKHWLESSTIRRKKYQIEHGMLQPESISEIRIYNMAKKLLGIRANLREQDEGKRIEYERSFVKWRFAGDIGEALAQLASLVWIVAMIANKQQPIGQFLYVQRLVSTSLSNAASFVSQVGAIDEDLAKLRDYDQFMHIENSAGGTHRITQPIKKIEIKNVSFVYPGTTKKVLSNVSLEIIAGSHIAIVGENGAGKSTLIKLILGLYRPTSGNILLNGIDIHKYNISDWHKQLGVLLQDFQKYQFATIGDNINFGDIEVAPTKERIDLSLAQSEAQEVIDGLPRGLHTPASTWFEEEEGVKLSGGQWQRIALARNFYRQAPFIILDEPTSAIDALAEANIFDRLFNSENKNTVITISHRLTTIEAAKIIYVFKNGQIVQQGTHKQLSAQDSGEYVHMFRRQLKNNSSLATD